MYYNLNMETAEPAGLDSLVSAPYRLDRWQASRRARGQRKGESTTREAAVDIMADFDEVLRVTKPTDFIEVSWSEDSGDPPDRSDELDAALELIRKVRASFAGATYRVFFRYLSSADPELAARFSVRAAEVKARMTELEALLVFLGAGTDDDAHLGEHLIPRLAD